MARLMVRFVVAVAFIALFLWGGDFSNGWEDGTGGGHPHFAGRYSTWRFVPFAVTPEADHLDLATRMQATRMCELPHAPNRYPHSGVM
jgi:hypothetical protein